ncbi:MAG TPA: hypothetical protein VGQ24_17170 [Gemmatimonadales bacterium]|nr:hypothetical protein [Gemmatimonadales bacterium]
MHPRLAELVDYATVQRTALLGAVSTVPEPLRDERIHTGSVQIAEIGRAPAGPGPGTRSP